MKVPNWLNQAEYPFQSKEFRVNGHTMHYIDEGTGEVLLFVHGTPSWSFDFRNVIRSLRSDYRCIAVDHIGFGLSEKPGDYDYSTQNHSNTLERFVLEKDLHNITLVMHDFGGPIGFNMALRHPERIKNIVVLNSWLWSSEGEPAFIQFKKILKSPLLPFLYRVFNFSAKFLLPRSFGTTKLSPEIHRHYTLAFPNRNQREGTVAFAKSLLNDQEWFEELWGKRQALMNKPLLLIWGMKDTFVTPAYLEKFQFGFPGAVTKQIPTAGHFPQEERPEEVARQIRLFMETNSNQRSANTNVLQGDSAPSGSW